MLFALALQVLDSKDQITRLLFQTWCSNLFKIQSRVLQMAGNIVI